MNENGESGGLVGGMRRGRNLVGTGRLGEREGGRYGGGVKEVRESVRQEESQAGRQTELTETSTAL